MKCEYKTVKTKNKNQKTTPKTKNKTKQKQTNKQTNKQTTQTKTWNVGWPTLPLDENLCKLIIFLVKTYVKCE